MIRVGRGESNIAGLAKERAWEGVSMIKDRPNNEYWRIFTRCGRKKGARAAKCTPLRSLP